ncbi:MAG: hypothetical protein B6D46_13860 [Polyangiaceae bacterium UTPRO1]|jgi:hypothetical protein|nr:hypothetical protein [Myxococcales bacterium]OQY65395.1 MAG: hypothetical protein B6D46_13860 [Polyangiaceae bacterium UTPRO1]
MFHARIVSPRGSLYVAAEVTLYDLENLRTHVYDLRTAVSTDTRVELRIDRPSSTAARHRLSSFLQQLEAEGVRTSFSSSPPPESSPGRGDTAGSNGAAPRKSPR